MSDGPYKSLKMPVLWRKFAQLTEGKAASDIELEGALERAIRKDFQNEIPSLLVQTLKKLFNENEQGRIPLKFFPNENDFSELRLNCAGYPFAETLINFAQQAFLEGKSGEKALLEVFRKTINERVGRGFRQYTEHYKRAAARENINLSDAIKRATTAVSSLESQALASTLIEGKKIKPLPKLTGLDDGVPFR